MPRNRTLGTATVAMLRAISQGRRFGLDIMAATNLPSGTVYPTLSRLEERGYIVGEWESEREAKIDGRPRRRYYEITPDGRRAVRDAMVALGLMTADAAEGGA